MTMDADKLREALPIYDLTASGRPAMPREVHFTATDIGGIGPILAGFFDEGYARVLVTLRKVPE